MAHAFLLGGLALAGLWMARNIPLFAIACAPILASWTNQALARFDRWMEVEKKLGQIDTKLRGWLWPILITIAAIGLIAIRDARDRSSLFTFNPGIFPVQAIDWLQSHPQDGKMFNDFNWGGYILYRLWPGQQVFIDSQSDFYGETFVKQYEQIITAQGNWQGELSGYDVQWAILPSQSLLAEALSRDSNWQVDYHDSLATILSRK